MGPEAALELIGKVRRAVEERELLVKYRDPNANAFAALCGGKLTRTYSATEARGVLCTITDPEFLRLAYELHEYAYKGQTLTPEECERAPKLIRAARDLFIDTQLTRWRQKIIEEVRAARDQRPPE